MGRLTLIRHGQAKRLVEEGHRRATDILTGMRETLNALASMLDEKEVISGDEVKQLISRKQGERHDPTVTQ